MFPLTRQSFVKFVAVWLTFGGISSNSELAAQVQGPPPPAAVPVQEKWVPPSWLMDQVAAEKFGREKIKLLQNLKVNNPSSAQVKELSRVAEFYLSVMTHDGVRQRIPKEVTQRLMGDLLTPSNRPNARAALMDEIIRRVPEIINHPSDLVRTNIVLMLTELSIEPANFQTQTPAIPYAPTHKILIQILGDSQQLRECRIIAARGLGRICRDDENNALSSTERSDVAVALVDALAAVPSSHLDEDWWYRFRIAESLGFVNRLDNVGGKPIVIDSLLETLSNPAEQLLVRTQAALSISRLPYTGSTNVQLITNQIGKLLLRLTAEFAKDPAADHWRDYFSRVFVAFRPETQLEANKGWGLLYQVKKGGLTGSSAYVDAAFERAMPIFKAVLEPEKPSAIPASAVKTFQEWVSGNQPSNRKVTPSSPELK